MTCLCPSNLVLPWQPYFDRCFFTILSFTVLNEKFYFHFANFYIFTPFESSYVAFQWLLSNVIGFSRFWKKQGITSGDVIKCCYWTSKETFWVTCIIPRHFLVKALILSELDQFLSSQFSTSDVQGMGGLPAPIRFFLNFSNMILHQHLPFSEAVRIYLRHILT